MNPQRLENFRNAVDSLGEYVREPITSKRDLAGIVFGFVLAYELAWKCLQEKVGELGYSERGPKPVLSAALQAKLIDVADEPHWAQMLQDRNLASHVYDAQFAEQLSARISGTHLRLLQQVLGRLQL